MVWEKRRAGMQAKGLVGERSPAWSEQPGLAALKNSQADLQAFLAQGGHSISTP